ncbi:MAG: hypothetical protein ACREF7_02750, partial [Candidatus Saccharimonadales bacterium]
AGWLGISTRSLERWRSHDTQPADPTRLKALATIVAQLRFVFRPSGLAVVLTQPNPAWGGRSIIQILDDPKLVREATASARTLRG